MYKTDSYHVQPSIDGYEVIIFDGSNVMYRVETDTEAQAHKVGREAINPDGEDWMEWDFVR